MISTQLCDKQLFLGLDTFATFRKNHQLMFMDCIHTKMFEVFSPRTIQSQLKSQLNNWPGVLYFRKYPLRFKPFCFDIWTAFVFREVISKLFDGFQIFYFFLPPPFIVLHIQRSLYTICKLNYCQNKFRKLIYLTIPTHVCLLINC